MSRYLDIHSGRIWIRFPADPELLSVVRALPERTFDGGERAWHVPEEHFGVVVQRLESHRFKFSPAFRARWEEHEDTDDATDGWTVRQVNEHVRGLLEQRFTEAFWVVGELQSFDRNDKRGNAYFQLVERPRPNADPVAEVNCVCFRRTRMQLAGKLREIPGLQFGDGMKVRLLVRPTLYPEKGRFQLVMEDLDPFYTEGEILARRERVVAAMEAAGIAKQNRALPMPELPLRVALVTSASGDARRDFEVELQQSGYLFQVELFEAAMQGKNTEETVLTAFRRVFERADEFDVVCLVRGGGARSDLSYFDTEAIARAVCEAPLKFVVGVGHERDRCALDELATRAKTPTAAAQILVERVEQQALRIERMSRRLETALERELGRQRTQWRSTALAIAAAAPERLARSKQRFDRGSSELIRSASARIAEGSQVLAVAESRLGHGAMGAVRQARRAVNEESSRLSPERLTRASEHRSALLERLAERLERSAANVIRDKGRALDAGARALRLLHPDRVVERGYAIVRNADGVVSDVGSLAQGDRVEVQLRDGRLTVDVESVEIEENEDE